MVKNFLVMAKNFWSRSKNFWSRSKNFWSRSKNFWSSSKNFWSRSKISPWLKKYHIKRAYLRVTNGPGLRLGLANPWSWLYDTNVMLTYKLTIILPWLHVMQILPLIYAINISSATRFKYNHDLCGHSISTSLISCYKSS